MGDNEILIMIAEDNNVSLQETLFDTCLYIFYIITNTADTTALYITLTHWQSLKLRVFLMLPRGRSWWLRLETAARPLLPQLSPPQLPATQVNIASVCCLLSVAASEKAFLVMVKC